MSQDHFRDYLNVIGRYPLLTPEQEIQLSRQVHRMLALKGEGRPLTKREEREVKIGKRAKDAIINSNLRLVVHIAKRYKMRLRSDGMEMMDLIQEGVFGLHRATELFDSSRGYKFSTYAYWWIRQAINRAIENKSRMIRVPVNALKTLHDASRQRVLFMQQNGRWPTDCELASILRITIDELTLLVHRSRSHRSLDALITDDGSPLIDVIPDQQKDDTDLSNEYRSSLYECLALLNEDEQSTLIDRYGLGGVDCKTLGEIGAEKCVTRERIRQRINNAQRKLKLMISK